MSEFTRAEVVRSRKRRRRVPAAIIAALGGSALLSLSLTGTLSGFVASIANSTNTAATGTLIMQEQNSGQTVTCLSTDGGSISTNAATCTTINKFGGSTTMVPGGTGITTDITIKNTGTATASTFSLTPGATCTKSNNGTLNGTATDICDKMNIAITSDGTSVFSGTLEDLAGHAAFALSSVAPGASVPFRFVVTLDSTAGNTYQGLAASVPLTWSFAS
ncbi:MAG: hypothetical protein B5766_03955 [Candidatus Lumbricidophila eiseniae]|uniref:Uncharacterized protein n=1 Tax=Candidatus Lumbricidiphila eiseniae TaxID=1969409 RepID=A0A2A6FT15_9MICO|nr:MAG: hypothetical protein B5766_03955 [Candidatus Lumbricidophila eiseniae]